MAARTRSLRFASPGAACEIKPALRLPLVRDTIKTKSLGLRVTALQPQLIREYESTRLHTYSSRDQLSMFVLCVNKGDSNRLGIGINSLLKTAQFRCLKSRPF
jgi:hypothetical protein